MSAAARVLVGLAALAWLAERRVALLGTTPDMELHSLV